MGRRGWHPRGAAALGIKGPGGHLPGGAFQGTSYDPSLHSPPQPSQRCALLWASKPFIRTLTALLSECFSESRVSL